MGAIDADRRSRIKRQALGSDHLATANAITVVAIHDAAERRFCSRCGSALWVWDPRWPELVHPFASAIDTPLPKPPEQVHMMLGAKPNWARLDAKKGEMRFDYYPEESLDDWHRRHGLLEEA